MARITYILISIILCICVVVFLGWMEPTPKIIKQKDMEIINYSCGRGENPENTIIGIKHCQAINPDWRIEMDVQITSDEQLVLFHDYNTKRITGQDKLINDLSLKEVGKLNAGYNFKNQDGYIYRSAPIKIPVLRAVFNTFPKARFLLDIHTNNPKVVQILIELIDTQLKKGDFIIVSEYDGIIKKLKGERPNWRYGVPANEAKKMLYSSFLYLDRWFPIKSDILMLPKKYGKLNVLSKRVINHAKKRNKKIWAWIYEGEFVKTVNSKFEMEELGKIGIEGIFTDYPERLSNEMR